MELIGTFICYCLGLTNLFLLIYIIGFIFINRKKYPFTKTYPLSELLFMICVFFHQALQFALSYFIYLDDINRQNKIHILTSFFDHFLCFIPVLLKLIKVRKIFEISCQYLNIDFYKYLSESKKGTLKKDPYNDFIQERKKKHNPDPLLALKIFIIMSVILSFFIFLYIKFPCICYHLSYGVDFLNIELECETWNSKILESFEIIKNFIYYGLLFILLQKILEIWKYTIKYDIFYVRIEITVNAVWIVSHNIVYHSYSLLSQRKTSFNLLIYSFLIDFSLTIFHLFLIMIKMKQELKPKKKDNLLKNNFMSNDQNKNHIVMMNDFNKSMKNVICFLYFKDYIPNKENKADLEFYVDYYLYKTHINKANSIKKTDIIIHCYHLYDKYFKKDNNDNHYLDVPSYIIDDIEERKNDFYKGKNKLYTIFDEAFKEVYTKLSIVYSNLMGNTNFGNSLKKILDYTELDEINDEIIIE